MKKKGQTENKKNNGKNKGRTENKKNKENKNKNSDGIAEHKHAAMRSPTEPSDENRCQHAMKPQGFFTDVIAVLFPQHFRGHLIRV